MENDRRRHWSKENLEAEGEHFGCMVKKSVGEKTTKNREEDRGLT